MEQSFSSLPPGIKYDPIHHTYKLDLIKVIDGHRIHLYRSNLDSLDEAIWTKETLTEQHKKQQRQQKHKEMSFKDFFDDFLSYRSRHVRFSSLSQAQSVLHKYFSEDALSPTSIVLSQERMEKVYQTILLEDICPSWKNRIFGVLRRMVAYAKKLKILDAESYEESSSILENIPEPRLPKEKIIWTEKEKHRFFDAITIEPDKTMFSLFFELGARLSEFLGLTWEAYDSKRGIIVIARQLLHNSQKTFVLSDALKTKESYRECKLSAPLKEALNEYKKKAPISPYMFTSKEDPKLPLSKAAFRRAFAHYIERSGVSRITPHAVRHMRATALLQAAKNMLEVKAIARYLGHSASILMDVYSHAGEKTIEAVLRRLG